MVTKGGGGVGSEGGLCLVVSKRRWAMVVTKVAIDGSVNPRWLKAKVAVGGHSSVWIGLHYGVSSPTRNDKYQAAIKHVDKCVKMFQECERDCEHVVWMGDSNFIANTEIDRAIWDQELDSYRAANSRDSSEYLHSTFVAHTEAQDMWIRMHGDKEGFTRQHWGAREGIPASLSRIDHIFATDKVANSISKVGVAVGANVIESDHRMLAVELDLRALTGRVPEMWGKNDNHLQKSEERVVESVKGIQ